MKKHENLPEVVQGGYGWLQVVTGDSKEEVLIFRDKQTPHHNIYIIIIITSIETFGFFHQHHWWVGFNIFKNKEIIS